MRQRDEFLEPNVGFSLFQMVKFVFMDLNICPHLQAADEVDAVWLCDPATSICC